MKHHAKRDLEFEAMFNLPSPEEEMIFSLSRRGAGFLSIFLIVAMATVAYLA